MIKHPKYRRGNIYLSGGMEYAEALGAGWRTETSRRLKQMGYYPIDIAALDAAYQAEHGDIIRDPRFDGDQSEAQRKANIRLHFIDTDLKLIENDTDALIVLYDESARRGAGTISECQHAFNRGIPVFIMSAWQDWKSEVPSWLHALSTKMFTSFDDLYQYLEDLPEGILIRDQYGNHGAGNQYLCSLTGEPFEKQGHHFVSQVHPLYSKESVELVRHTHENMKNRYEFFREHYIENAHLD